MDVLYVSIDDMVSQATDYLQSGWIAGQLQELGSADYDRRNVFRKAAAGRTLHRYRVYVSVHRG